MNARAVLLTGLALMSPAWAQEPATSAPAPAPRSFDLSSDSIKKIVHATAATQYAAVQVNAEAPVEREPAIVFDQPEKPAPPIKAAAKRRAPAPARESASEGFLSAVVDILVDELLGVDVTNSLEEEYNKTLGCNEHPDLNTSTPMLLTCPGRYPKQDASMAGPIRP
jgi:hypothetical protein